MSVELHLPDLPEVPVSVGPVTAGPSHVRTGGLAWLRELFGASLPLMMMALLAVGTWWLVKTAPQAPRSGPVAPPRHDPDYRLEHFTIERFQASGERMMTLQGDRLRHYPDTDDIDIDVVHLHATGPKREHIEATARQAQVSGKADWVVLQDGANVTSTAPGEAPVQMTGERLRVSPRQHLVEADLPVRVHQEGNEFNAQSMEFNGVTRQLMLHGPARIVLQPIALRQAGRKP